MVPSPLTLLLLFVAAVGCSAACWRPAPIIPTSSGDIVGCVDDATGAAVYRSIPYAAPPIGDLRFAPPAPPAAWTGVRNVSAQPAACLQFDPPQRMRDTTSSSRVVRSSEDCLYITVVVPRSLVVPAPVPLLLHLHGGGYISGYAGPGSFDFVAGAAASGLIIAYPQYRLGVLGFFVAPGMLQGGGGQSGAATASSAAAASNVGLRDQRAALAWMASNAAAFGGDPRALTLSGFSAGGMSTLIALTHPQWWPLFRSAVLQSPGSYLYPAHRAMQWYERVAASVGCPAPPAAPSRNDTAAAWAGQLACLRAVPGTEAAWVTNVTASLSGKLTPVVDGDTVVGYPPALAAAGLLRPDAPILVGNNAFEGDILLGAASPLPDWDSYVRRLMDVLGSDDADDAAHVAAVRAVMDPIAAASSPTDGVSTYVGEAGLACGAVHIGMGVGVLVAAGRPAPPLFRYVSTFYLPECAACQVLNRSTHGTDVHAMQFVAGLTPAHTTLAASLWNWTANFAAVGAPSGGPRGPPVAWPVFDPSGAAPTVLRVDDAGTALTRSWQEEHCAALLRTGLM